MGWLGMATCKGDIWWKTWKWWGGKEDIWGKNVYAARNSKLEGLGGRWKVEGWSWFVWGKEKVLVWLEQSEQREDTGMRGLSGEKEYMIGYDSL